MTRYNTIRENKSMSAMRAIKKIFMLLACALAAFPAIIQAQAKKYECVLSMGLSARAGAQESAKEAAQRARDGLGGDSARLVLVFPATKDMLNGAVSGVKEVFPSGIIFGGPSPQSGRLLTRNLRTDNACVIALGGDIGFSWSEANNNNQLQSGETMGRALKQADIPAGKGRFTLMLGDCHNPQHKDVVKGLLSVLGNDMPVIGGVTDMIVTQGNITNNGKNMALLVWGGFRCHFGMAALGSDRSAETILAKARQSVTRAMGYETGKPSLALLFNCGGRFGLMSGLGILDDEAAAITEALGGDFPFVTTYSAGEMGKEDDASPARGEGFAVSTTVIYANELKEPSNIKLTSPDGGEEWNSGTGQTISWQATEDIDSVKLEYTTDDGATWTVIAASVAATPGEYAWTVPAQASSVKVRVSALDGTVSDTSGEFTTDIAAPPYNAALDITLTKYHLTINGPGRHVIDVFNITGELILSFAGAGEKSYVMNHAPEPGVYVVKVRHGEKVLSRRFAIIQ